MTKLILVSLAIFAGFTSTIHASEPEAWHKLGKSLFKTYCAVCHMEDGSGKVGFAPSIRNQDFLAIASDDFIRRTIIEGRPGTAMTPRPEFNGMIADSIIAYLRSLESKTRKKIQVDYHFKAKGDPQIGKKLYANYCSSCHGPNGEGYSANVPGTAIGLSGFLSHASDGFILETMKIGRVGTAMKPMIGPAGVANLSIQDAEHIISFLRKKSPDTHQVVIASKTQEEASRGKTLYNANCAACHQEEGRGKVGFAPAIGNQDFLALATDQFIIDTVKKGRPGTSMPPRPDLKDADIKAMVSYLRSLERGLPDRLHPNPKFVARGSAKNGKLLFDRNCQYCHGIGGSGYASGGSGPAIGLKGFLSVASDDFIYQTIEKGRNGTAMKPFVGARGLANLNQQEAQDLVVYLRSLNH